MHCATKETHTGLVTATSAIPATRLSTMHRALTSETITRSTSAAGLGEPCLGLVRQHSWVRGVSPNDPHLQLKRSRLSEDYQLYVGLRGQQGNELTAWSGGCRARATGDSMGRRGQRGTQGACTTEYSRVQQGRRRWRGTAEQRGLRCAAGDNVAARNAGCSRDSVYRMGPGGSRVPTAGNNHSRSVRW